MPSLVPITISLVAWPSTFGWTFAEDGVELPVGVGAEAREGVVRVVKK